MLKNGREKGETDRTNKLTDRQTKQKDYSPRAGKYKKLPMYKAKWATISLGHKLGAIINDLATF